jgi:hypothetical protein
VYKERFEAGGRIVDESGNTLFWREICEPRRESAVSNMDGRASFSRAPFSDAFNMRVV